MGVKDAIIRLKKGVPGIRIAIIAYGDYCDARSSYVTKIFDFSEGEKALCQCVQNVGSTGGGNADECYELVLREARTKLAWRAGSTRSPVLLYCQLHDGNLLQGGGWGNFGQLRDQGGGWRKEYEPGASPSICHSSGMLSLLIYQSLMLLFRAEP